MRKNEYLDELLSQLKKNNIADAADIVSEYEQHFAFKMADGFSEEEICAKLPKPAVLASQFESNKNIEKSGGRKLTTMIGLVFADVFSGLFFVLLFAFEGILSVFSLTCAVLGICLIFGLNVYSLIPTIPYWWCSLLFGFSFLALSALSCTGCIYFAAFIRQLMRSYGRFHKNAISAASGNAVLPSIAINPQIPAKTNRRIRTVMLLSIAIFAVCFVLAMIISAISSGALGFWHTWGWFGYNGV